MARVKAMWCWVSQSATASAQRWISSGREWVDGMRIRALVRSVMPCWGGLSMAVSYVAGVKRGPADRAGVHAVGTVWFKNFFNLIKNKFQTKF